MAYGRGERRGPGVLPYEHRGGAGGLDRGGDGVHVVLAEQHRQLALVRAQPSELALIEVGELERLDRAVGVLLQHEQVEYPDQVALDEVAERRRDLAVEPTPGELDHDPVDRPQLVEVADIVHLDTLLAAVGVDLPPTCGSFSCESRPSAGGAGITRG